MSDRAGSQVSCWIIPVGLVLV